MKQMNRIEFADLGEYDYSLDSVKTGILTGTNKNRFIEGFSFTLFKDTEIYEDQDLT